MSAVLAWTPRPRRPWKSLVGMSVKPPLCMLWNTKGLGSDHQFAGPDPFLMWPNSGSFSVSRGSSCLASRLGWWWLSVALVLTSLPLQLLAALWPQSLRLSCLKSTPLCVRGSPRSAPSPPGWVMCPCLAMLLFLVVSLWALGGTPEMSWGIALFWSLNNVFEQHW